jgi:hypothetical protein
MVLFLPLLLFHINHPTIPNPRRQKTVTTDKTITKTSVVEAKTKVFVVS